MTELNYVKDSTCHLPSKSKTAVEYENTYAPYKKFIGSIVPNWVMRRTDISQGAKLCFGRLAQYAGKGFYAFPGLDKLACELGVSESSAKGYIAELRRAKLIHAQKMGSAKNSRYFFLHHADVEFKTESQNVDYQLRDKKARILTPESLNPIPPYIEENQGSESNGEGSGIEGKKAKQKRDRWYYLREDGTTLEEKLDKDGLPEW